MRFEDMPEPECAYGYTVDQIREIVDDVDKFNAWMYGQTVALCDGTGHCTTAHGLVVYRSDAQRYLWGLPVVD